MERIVNLVPKSVFIFAKIGLIAAILIITVHYTFIKFALHKAGTQASLDGYINQTIFSNELAKTGLASKIEVVSADPSFGSRVNKLGDPLTITVRYNVSLPVYDSYKIELGIPISTTVANEGYYGAGY